MFYIFLLSIAFLVLAIKRLDWALMLLLALLPSYAIRFSLLGIPFTFLEVIILTTFAVWVFQETKFTKLITGKVSFKSIKTDKLKRKRYPFQWEIIIILIISYLSLFHTGFSNSALGIWKAYFFEAIVIYFLVLNIFKTKNIFKRVIWPLSISAFYISLFAIYQKITGNFIDNPFWAAENTRRVTSFFDYPNAVGLFLAPIILLMTSWAFEKFTNTYENYREKGAINKTEFIKFTFLSLNIIISLLACLFAKSEGALIGIAAGIFIFGFLLNKKMRIVTSLGALVFLLIIFSYPKTNQYFREKLLLKDLSGEIRKQQWRETTEMLLDGRVIQGSGLDNYQASIKPYHQEGIFFNKDRDPDFRRKIVIFDDKYRAERWQPTEVYMYPHNIFLNFWTELGLIGLIAFIVLIFRFTYFGIKNINTKDKYIAIGLVSTMTVIIVHGLVDVPYFKNDLSVMFWVLIAMMGIIKLKQNGRTK